MPPRPFGGHYRLGDPVIASDYRWYVESAGRLLKDGDDGVIGGNLAIGCRSLQERLLDGAELAPVQHDGDEVQLERAHDLLDVVHSQFIIPAVVQVYRQGAQAEPLLGEVGHV